jgi:hypothetical protein
MTTVATSAVASPTVERNAQLRSALLAGSCVILPGFVALALAWFAA